MNLNFNRKIKPRRISMHIKAILFLLSVNFIYSQDYTYSIEDINQTSDYYGNYISPSDFSGQVTLHYFGHQN